MNAYYLSRFLLSVLVGVFLIITGSLWWAGLLAALLAFGWFLAAPHIGRYSVHPEFGVTALRRDERSQGINDKAARNAFVISMLVLGAAVIYLGATAAPAVSTDVLKWLLVLGALAYYASDFWLRKAQS